MTSSEPLVQIEGLTKYFYENDSALDRLLGTIRHRLNGDDGDSWGPTAVRAVDGLDFEIHRGETVGLVGESGCGKSTTGETILRLQDATGGAVRFDGDDVFSLAGDDLDQFRRSAQIVFQDPYSSLDPRMSIGKIVREPLDIHGWPVTDSTVPAVADVTVEGIDRDRVSVEVADDIDRVVPIVHDSDGNPVARTHVTVRHVRDANVTAQRNRAVDGDVVVEVTEDLSVSVAVSEGAVRVSVSVGRSDRKLRDERVRELLEVVGLSGDQYDRYPHEFSGGQRQRVGIARALALEPEFIVLDEPTSALDVSVQAQILNLLDDLQDRFDLTYLLISHDLSVIRHICDRIAVMYLGEIVEIGPIEEIFNNPCHPYTEALLASVPRPSTAERDRDLEPLTGDVPSPRSPPSGCRFRTRCPKVIPPEDMTIDQALYRDLMDFRQHVENREFSIEAVAEAVPGPIPAETDPSSAVVDAFIQAQRDRLFDGPIPAPHAEIVEQALAAVLIDEWNTAETLLRDHYESLCEQRAPRLAGTPHPAACHLHVDPDPNNS